MNRMNGEDLIWTPRARTKDVVTEGIDYEEMRRIVSDAIRRGVATPGPLCVVAENTTPIAKSPKSTVIKCAICDTSFTRKTNNARFCSVACSKKNFGKTLDFKPLQASCDQCGTQYLKKAHNGRFCSARCSGRNNKNKFKLLNGGKLTGPIQ